MEKNLMDYDIHYGICMDVFVIAGVAERKTQAILQKNASLIMSILLEKYYAKTINRPLSRLEKALYRFIPEIIRRLIIRLLEGIVFLETDKCSYCYNTYYAVPDRVYWYRSSIFDGKNRIKMKFEDLDFWAPGDWEEYLMDDYDDWRSLPPKDKRVAHGDIIVDFEHDYKTYYTGNKC